MRQNIFQTLIFAQLRGFKQTKVLKFISTQQLDMTLFTGAMVSKFDFEVAHKLTKIITHCTL